MISKTFFLVSVMKGLEAYPRPLFWATLYVVFVFVTSYMFSLAGGASPLLLLGIMTLNFGLSAGYFTALRELDGIPYWITFIGGLLLLIWIP